MNEKFLGIWIPAEVLLNNTLADKEKLLLAIIFNLSIKTGYCYANNRYFSNLLNISIGRISKLINLLKQKEEIEIIYKYADSTKALKTREIYLKNKILRGIVKNNHTPSQKRLEGIVKNVKDIKYYNKKIYNYNRQANFKQRPYTKEFLDTLYENFNFDLK